MPICLAGPSIVSSPHQVYLITRHHNNTHSSFQEDDEGGSRGPTGALSSRPPGIQAMRSRSVWGSFIQNDHIDQIFRMNSIADQTTTASSAVRRPTFTTVDESGSGASCSHVFSSGSGTPPPFGVARSPGPVVSPLRGSLHQHQHQHQQHDHQSPRRASVEPTVEEGNELGVSGGGSGPTASVI